MDDPNVKLINQSFEEQPQATLAVAESYFKQALNVHSTETKAMAGLAMVYVFSHKYSESHFYFQKALELNSILTEDEQIACDFVRLVAA